jgi:dGTPase
MRHSVTLASAEALARLDERLPSPPLGPSGDPQPGEPADGARGRYRSAAQRDRDRILYCSWLQRLGGVTQVTESESGHTFHNRLTHSIKVAQVARRLAEKLLQDREDGKLVGRAAAAVDAVDPDSAEAAGLAHDLGHPPFGHVAEQILRDATPASFEGNPQSFRIVTALAIRKLGTPGLSLTRRTLNGMLKYPWLRGPEGTARHKKWAAYGEDAPAFEWVRRDSPSDELSLTARIMDWADDVTYAVHDLDDFFRAGLVPLHLLGSAGDGRSGKELERFAAGLKDMGRDDIDQRLTALQDVLSFALIDEPYEGRDDQRAALRVLASRLITDYLAAFSVAEGSAEGQAQVVIDDQARAQVDALKDLTWVYVVRRPELAVMQAGRREMISKLAGWYLHAAESANPSLFPAAYRERLASARSTDERSRLVNDLVAGLTEDAALALFRRMSGVDPGSVLDATARGR